MRDADREQQMRVDKFMESTMQLQEASRKIQNRVQTTEIVHPKLQEILLPVKATIEAVVNESSVESVPPEELQLTMPETLSQKGLPQETSPQEVLSRAQNLQEVKALPLQVASLQVASSGASSGFTAGYYPQIARLQ